MREHMSEQHQRASHAPVRERRACVRDAHTPIASGSTPITPDSFIANPPAMNAPAPALPGGVPPPDPGGGDTPNVTATRPLAPVVTPAAARCARSVSLSEGVSLGATGRDPVAAAAAGTPKSPVDLDAGRLSWALPGLLMPAPAGTPPGFTRFCDWQAPMAQQMKKGKSKNACCSQSKRNHVTRLCVVWFVNKQTPPGPPCAQCATVAAVVLRFCNCCTGHSVNV